MELPTNLTDDADRRLTHGRVCIYFAALTRPYRLQSLDLSRFNEVLSLAKLSFSKTSWPWVKCSLDEHKTSREAEINDGREFFVLERDGRLVGVTGYHCYSWGPEDVCWGSWFFVHPQYRSSFIPFFLARGLLTSVRDRQFRALFIETDGTDEDLYGISKYLDQCGIDKVASIPGYFDQYKKMEIYKISLR